MTKPIPPSNQFGLRRIWLLMAVIFLVMASMAPVTASVSSPFSLSFVNSNYNGFGVSCNGASDGSIDMTISGGTAPFVILWSNGATTEDISGLTAGTYTVTVTDNDLDVNTETVIITEPDVISIALTPVPSNCSLSNGEITSVVTGGDGSYGYLWSNGATSSDIASLAAGSFTVTVTDGNGCTGTQSTTVTATPPPAVVQDSITDVSCFGGSDGAAYISVSDGNSPYSYSWSNGASSEDITGLAAGSYTVTVTDADLCTATLTVSVNEPATALNDSINTTNATCGLSNGAATVYPFDGTGPYTQLWSTGSTSATITGLAAGNYTVTVTDDNGCTVTDVATVSATTPPAVVQDSITDVSCFSSSDGAAYISVSNGTLPYSYSWSNGASSEDITGLAAGNYTVTVTDADLCTATLTVSVSEPATALDDSVNTTNTTCGLSNGAATVYPYDGTGPYTQLWSTGSTSATITGLAAGNYTVTVTDDNGCTVTDVVSVSATTPPSVVQNSITNVSCFGGSNGAANISVSNGSTPYSYSWSNGASTEDITGLTVGSYTVTVTDADLCTATLTVTITGPATALNDSVNSTNTTCGLSNGAATVYPYDGTGPYSQLWSTGSTSATITGLAAGNYTVTVTDDNGCTVTDVVSVSATTPPSVVQNSITNVSCFGGSNGAANISVSNGSTPYSYSWSNGASSEDITGLTVGSYTVTVTDADLCTATLTVIITGPATALNDSVNSTNTTCGLSNGAATVYPYDGTGPYTQLWSTGSTSATITGLAAGNYTVTVTDNNGCTVTDVATVSATTPPAVVQDSITDVSCFGGSDGAAYISVSNGTLPYSYSWSNGASSEDISGLAAGNYTVTVTDADLCTTTLTVSVNEPATALNDSINTTNATCGLSNGAATVYPFDGTGPYTQLWSTGSTSATITGLSAGNYTVTVTDDNGCSLTDVATVSATPPPSITLDSVVAVLCNGGSTGDIFISVSGGTAPYTYLWSNGFITQDLLNRPTGTYTVTVTDFAGCTTTLTETITQPAALTASTSSTPSYCGNNNGTATVTPGGGVSPYSVLWSTGATTLTITNLASGTYTVTVTDDNGCTKTGTRTISDIPGPVAVVDSIRHVKCFGQSTGAIYISAPGGSSPKTYLWSNGATSADLINVAAGTYTVTVTDANLCTSVVSATINQPAQALTNAGTSTIPAGCTVNNGEASISVTGGTTPYSYLWSNGSTTAIITGLTTGTFTVTVTDFNSCTIAASVVVSFSSNPAVVIDSVKNVSCFGGNNGSVYITGSGGTGALAYLWSNGVTSSDLINVAFGTYTVTVTDANGCTVQASQSLTQPVALAVSVQQSVNVSCNGASDGSINITVSGGTSPYNFNWSNGSTSEDITGLASGTYTVTVTDANNCTGSTSSIIIQPSVINVALTPVNPTCGSSNGSITASASGGTGPPFDYLWSNGSSSNPVTGLTAGTYTVTVTDPTGCTSEASATLTAVSPPTVVFDSIKHVNCFGGSDGYLSIQISGGTSPYGIVWSTGAVNTGFISGLTPGTYTVTVTDDDNCSTTASQTITQPSSALSVTTQTTQTACTTNTGTVQALVSGGTVPYTYLWSTGGTSSLISGLGQGIYTVTVTDDNGCTISIFDTVTKAGNPVISIDSIVNVGCFNASTGDIYITVSGGTPGYSYLWSTFATTTDLINIPAGTYNVSVTDANGCTSILAGMVVTQPSAALNDSVNVTAATCGVNNGSVTVYPFGGTSPYTYLWNNGATTQTISNLAAGNYTVTITDAKGCTRQRTIPVNSLNGPQLILDQIQNVSCFGGTNGSILISTTGGTIPFAYLWSNGAVSQDLTNVVAGTYTVTITDDNGCINTLSAVINEPASAVNDSIVVINGTCNLPNGSATVYPYGGTPYTTPIHYNILWSNGQTTATITGLSAGTYTVTVTDSLGCSFTNSTTVGNTGTPGITILTINQVKCFGDSTGSIAITAFNGTPPYTYLWSNGSTNDTISNLAAGIYTVTVTDAYNCTATSAINVTQPNPLALSLSISDATCGLANGSINVSTTGGTPTYGYLWNTGSTANPLVNLFAGNYTVTVTDFNGCTIDTSGTVADLDGPDVTLVSVVDVNCHGQSTGAINIAVNGGNGIPSFNWSNGSSSQNLTGIIAGTYTVTVTDTTGCIDTLSAQVNQNDSITVSAQITHAFCGTTGSITVTVSGGIPGYDYLWNNSETTPTISGLAGGNYTVTVTDQFFCSVVETFTIIATDTISIIQDSIRNVNCFGQSTGAIYTSSTGGLVPFTYSWTDGVGTPLNVNSPTLNNITAGNYTLIVSDTTGCADTLGFVVNQQPDLVIDSLKSNSAYCNLNNGNVKVYPNGGTPFYSYQWSPGGCTSQTCIGLAPGSYSVTVTDIYGCTVQNSVVVGQIPIQTITQDSVIAVTCSSGSDGAIYIQVNAGKPPYSYLWNNGFTGEDAIGLIAGTYTVTVTDSTGCQVNASFVVTEPGAIQHNGLWVDATCGLNNGSITINPTGGTGQYTCLWSNGDTTFTTDSLAPGTYTVTVTDIANCTAQFSFVIDDFPAPVLSLANQQNATCFGWNDASITIGIGMGTAPISILWTTGDTVATITNLAAGTYCVTLTDANGCTDSDCYTVTQPDSISATADIINVACGSAIGSITVYPVGGNGGYSYLWGNGQTGQSILNLNAGFYTVTVTDSMSCSNTFTYQVIDQGSPAVSIDSTLHVICAGDTSGSIYLNISGASPPFNILWSNGSVNDSLLNVAAGSYSVLITDANGCTAALSQVITEPDSIKATFAVAPANCNTNNGAIATTATGGTGNLQYNWSTGATTPDISNLTAGVYTLIVEDSAGCTMSFQVPVSNISAPTITVTDSVDVTCADSADGSITISVSGGQLPYDYQWNSGQTTPAITGLNGGIYIVTVTDALGCIAIQTVSIYEPLPIVLTAFIPQLNDTFNLTCYDSNDGSIFLTTGGGTPQYSYIWSNLATIDTIVGLSAKTYTVTVTDANGCKKTASYTLTQPPQLLSFAGANSIICGADTITLSANNPTYGTGTWSVISGTGILADSTQNITLASNLSNGTNIFQWVVTDSVCSAVSQVIIDYFNRIEAVAGGNRTLCTDSVVLAAIAPQFGTGYWTTVSSDGMMDDSTSAVTAVYNLNIGQNIFRWIVINGTCTDSVDVKITRTDPETCLEQGVIEIPSGITPNNDGRNDFFVIHGIELYPDNLLTIYNRWGNIVYKKHGYANEWNGVNMNAELLPDGTYFYVLNIDLRKISRVYKGYIDLRK